MTDRELMQMALDALEEYKNVVTSGTDPNNFGGVVDGGEPARKAIKALRDRLAQPEWVGFTEEEAWEMLRQMSLGASVEDVRFIETKLKEKNT